MSKKSIYISKYSSPIGDLTLASGGTCLSGLWIDGQKYFEYELLFRTLGEKVSIDDAQIEAVPLDALDIFIDTQRWLDDYFAKRQPKKLPKVKYHGTNFQEKVWKALTKIPYGTLTTYGAIASDLAKEKGNDAKMSARAVGVAVGKNPISIIVPCHRVVGANGSLTGYAGGLDRKKFLLELEGIE